MRSFHLELSNSSLSELVVGCVYGAVLVTRIALKENSSSIRIPPLVVDISHLVKSMIRNKFVPISDGGDGSGVQSESIENVAAALNDDRTNARLLQAFKLTRIEVN